MIPAAGAPVPARREKLHDPAQPLRFGLFRLLPRSHRQITALHAAYYAEYWGFDLFFEAQVASEIGQFMLALDPARDYFQTARAGERLAGAVALDGHSTPNEGARPRWFIVQQTWQGRGLGARLLDQALAFARAAGHRRLYLWTFAAWRPRVASTSGPASAWPRR
ncbi:MAG: GNAT family N-acetyltransferase [Thermodesulfobacteriota bacterium]